MAGLALRRAAGLVEYYCVDLVRQFECLCIAESRMPWRAATPVDHDRRRALASPSAAGGRRMTSTAMHLQQGLVHHPHPQAAQTPGKTQRFSSTTGKRIWRWTPVHQALGIGPWMPWCRFQLDGQFIWRGMVSVAPISREFFHHQHATLIQSRPALTASPGLFGWRAGSPRFSMDSSTGASTFADNAGPLERARRAWRSTCAQSGIRCFSGTSSSPQRFAAAAISGRSAGFNARIASKGLALGRRLPGICPASTKLIDHCRRAS